MRIIVSATVFLIFFNTAFSQTIINAERVIDGSDSTIYALSLSYNGTRGNSNTDMLDISPAIILVGNRNEFKILGGYNLLSQSGVGILNSGYIHLRHNFKISDRIKTFEFYQVQFNNVLLLDKREIIGAGLRLLAVDQKALKINFNLGAMRELEVLDTTRLLPGEIFETRYFRASVVNSLNLKLSKTLRLDNVFYFQPYLKDFSDYRLLNDLNLAVTVTTHLKLVIALSTRFDSKPPGLLKKLDNITNLGINLKF